MNKELNMYECANLIFDTIQRQFNKVMQNDPEAYAGYKIRLSIEQMKVRDRDRDPNIIYLVVKFLPSSLLLGQYVQSVTISAVSEHNCIGVCQQLLNEYAGTYNLKKGDGGVSMQTYTSPTVATNFNEVYDGFRTTFFMSGTFIVSTRANTFKIVDLDNNKEIECISNTYDFTTAMNTQLYFNSNNRTKSIGESGTFSFNIVTYLLDDTFINKCMGVACGDLDIDTVFNLGIEFKNGYKVKNTKFKLVNNSGKQNIGEIPSVTLTFTN